MVDAPIVAPPTPAVSHPAYVHAPAVASAPANKNVQRQIRKLGVADPAQAGGGTLLTEQILVVNQKAKLFERKAEYSVFNQQGHKVGGVRQFGTSMSRMVVGRENETKRLQIVDAIGQPILTLTRPATVLKSKVTVMRQDGTPVGQIVQENFGVMASVLGGRFNIRFRIEPAGKRSARSTLRVGVPGTSAFKTRKAPRLHESPRRGRGSAKKCSPKPTTTCFRCIDRSKIHCSHSSYPRRSPWIPC